MDSNVLATVKMWLYSRLHELPFRGLLITEGWEMSSQHIALPLVVTALIICVSVAKITYGNWDTAWTMVGSLIALLSLVVIWLRHAVG